MTPWDGKPSGRSRGWWILPGTLGIQGDVLARGQLGHQRTEALPGATSPWPGRCHLPWSDGVLRVVGDGDHGSERAVADGHGRPAAPWPRWARWARLFSNRMRSPDGGTPLPEARRISSPSSPPSRRPLPAMVVQRGHVAAGNSEDRRGGLAWMPHHRSISADGPSVDFSGDRDPVVGVVGGDGAGDLTLSELDEGLAFPLLVNWDWRRLVVSSITWGQSVRQARSAPPGSISRRAGGCPQPIRTCPGPGRPGLEPAQGAGCRPTRPRR